MIRILTIFVAVLMMAGALSACGRKGPPDSPPGTTYPHSYPDS